jgi:hypothetical protein
MHVTFVLLASAVSPDATAIAAAHRRLFPDQAPVVASPGSNDQVAELTNGGSSVLVALMPTPVPDGEADGAAAFSLSKLEDKGFELGVHNAHFIVTSMTPEPGIDGLWNHTRLVAAVVEAHGAMAVYDGNAHATHAPTFYVELAKGASLPLPLWSGISIAQPSPRHTEVLSVGLSQFGLPDIVVVGTNQQAGEAISLVFNLAAYVVRRGEPIPEDNTLGWTEDEKLNVRYVASPMNPKTKVARIVLPPPRGLA